MDVIPMSDPKEQKKGSTEELRMEAVPPSPNLYNSRVMEKGREIMELLNERDRMSLFNRDWWYGRLMEWSMKNERFKTQLFRFIDVFPYLQSGQEMARHLKEYFADQKGELPSVFGWGLGLGSLAPAVMAGTIRKNITQMAKMFITGETPQEALRNLKKSRQEALGFTIDLLGEATLSEKEATEYQDRYRELIEWLANDAEKWPTITQIDADENGLIPKVNVSIKLTALYSQMTDKAWDHDVAILKERLRPLLLLAAEKNVFINIDMEQFQYKDITLQVFTELLMEPELRSYPHFGIVVQAYLRSALEDIGQLLAFARSRQTPITVRLVKGAYWDMETVQAEQKAWPIPVFTNKKESDKNFEDCCRALIQGYPHVRLAVGSHNVRSIAAALVQAEEAGLDPRALEFQMLYGMADNIKRALVKKGLRVREYATVGALIPGMAYLVRRLLENTSNESFLRSKFSEDTPAEVLLRDPADDLEPSSPEPKIKSRPFFNEPLTDFTHTAAREKMREALERTRRQFGASYPLIVNLKEVMTDRWLERRNPAKPEEIVGKIALADLSHAKEAVEAAKQAFTKWRRVPVSERAQFLTAAANIMRRDRFELAALQVFECGKQWSEADADVAEAIDFCVYYAQEMTRLASGEWSGSVPGETNHYHHQPIGVAAVIAPWNFPLAILTGMTAAALVAGNTVVMKPAEQSSMTSYRLMKIFMEAGLPAGVLHHLSGYGEEVGAYLTSHPAVGLITFTGSKTVGLQIIERSAQVQPGQSHIKRCIVEMGGKNALIIDSDADLDEAVQGVLTSAFGFQGQKCSACSRVVVLEEIYDRFVSRLIEATRSLKLGPAEAPENRMGPVIDEEAYQRILGVIESGKSQAKMAYQAEVPADSGLLIPPTIFVDVPPDSPLAQEEIFGPILSVIRCRDLDEALTIANSVQYALTGGLYSRSPGNIERVKAEFDVGNLYINRGISGALVGRHPFGGHKMSGLGSKTGSPDYLLHFLYPRNVSENTLRRGFAPNTEPQG